MSGSIARASRNAVLKCAGVRTSFSDRANSNVGTRSRSFCFPSRTTSRAADASKLSRDGSPKLLSSSRAQATTSSTTSMEKYSATAALHLPRYLSSSNGTEDTSSKSVKESLDRDFFFFFLSLSFFFLSPPSRAPNPPMLTSEGTVAGDWDRSFLLEDRRTDAVVVGTVSQPSSEMMVRLLADRSRFTLVGLRPAFLSSSAWMSSWISWMVLASSTFRRGTQVFSRSSRRSLSAKRNRASNDLLFSSFLSCLK
mmetsp:Transcript_26253/g.68233  ORF Transcript_26253/g.68233 Transcript_26253/m.68233 type:complete len:253 (+) Transcript_26253:224-982(+)